MKIFLSHSNHDSDWEVIPYIDLACRVLGIELYIAERDKKLGAELKHKLLKNLESSDEFLALLTDHAAENPNVREEIGLATDSRRPNKPIFLAEDFSKLSVFHAGEEGEKLDRSDIVGSVCKVMTYFKNKLPKPLPPANPTAPRLKQPVCAESDNPKVSFNLTWDWKYDPKANPKLIYGEGVCTEHGLELKKKYFRGTYEYWKCDLCKEEYSEADYQRLQSVAISWFIKGAPPKSKKKQLEDYLGEKFKKQGE